ncbi:MAG TPA: S8 family serine peptidase [Methanocorpusculum sp.]|nr:S8 family serine peptidase [Methanocorpusculum sp.]
MKHTLQTILTITLLASLLFAAAAAAEAEYAEGQVFVCFSDDTVPEGIITDYTETVFGLYLIKTDMPVPDAVNYYAALANVIYAEPNYIATACSTTPNDPYYTDGSLWNMDNAQAPGAWDITTGSKAVIIAVLDTGINYNHEDLAGNMWVNEGEIPDNGIDDDNNGYIDDYYGYNFVSGTGDPMDDMGHGSHCAGTIGAVGNNSIGVAGMNWKTSLMAVKVLNAAGKNTASSVADGILYAHKEGAKILSMSLCVPYSRALDDVINAVSDDCLIVTAAGNEANDNDIFPSYPASLPHENVLAVAAIDDTDALSSFSNYGANSVDVAAPGSDIMSIDYRGGYKTDSGTSMATPLVAGVAGLMCSVNQNLKPFELSGIITKTADPIEDLKGKVVSGGKVNATRAVSVVKEMAFHDVYFNSTGGSEVYSEIALSGGTVEKPDNPVRGGYDFAGWFTDAEGGAQWNFSSPVADTMTLYAHWTAKDPAAHCGGDHDGLVWTEWTNAVSLPDTAGNYYLSCDVSLLEPWVVAGDVNLCLNGQTIQADPDGFCGNYLIQVPAGAKLTVHDCDGAGQISGYSINGRIPVYTDETAENTDAEPLLMSVLSSAEEEPEKTYSVSGIDVSGELVLKGGTLIDFKGGSGSGVAVNKDASFTLDGGTITRCMGGPGAAVYADSAKSVAIKSGTISHSSSETGAIYIKSSPFSMSGGKIAHCSASKQGGGIYFENCGSSTSITGGEIDSCIANFGGGIFLIGTDLVISDAKITNCAASYKMTRIAAMGGGIYAERGSKLTLCGNTVIDSCSVLSDMLGGGGGIYAEVPVVLKDSAKIVNCYCPVFAGGIYISNAVLTVEGDAEISGCKAGWGAYCVLMENSEVILKDNAVLSGAAGEGGENAESLKMASIIADSASPLSVSGNASVDSAYLEGQINADEHFAGGIEQISVQNGRTEPVLVKSTGSAEGFANKFSLSDLSSAVYSVKSDDSSLYLVNKSPLSGIDSGITMEKSGDKTIFTCPQSLFPQISSSDPHVVEMKDSTVGYELDIRMQDEIEIPYGELTFSGVFESVTVNYPAVLVEAQGVSSDMPVAVRAAVTLSEFPADGTFDTLSMAFDEETAARVSAAVSGAKPVAMLFGDSNDAVEEVSVSFTLPQDYTVPEKYEMAGFHAADKKVSKIVTEVSKNVYTLKGGGFSSYVLALVPKADPTPVHPSGGSQDTGSGNYKEYPRSVTNGGYVDFGSSRVVKGVTLPEGVSGSVVLSMETEAPAPEEGEVYLLFDLSVQKYPAGKESVISFSLSPSVIAAAGYQPEDVCLMHYGAKGWEKLATTYSAALSTISYEGVTTAFSPFAVVYLEGWAKPADAAEASEMPAASAKAESIVTDANPAPVAALSAVSAEKSEAPAATATAVASPLWAFGVIGGLCAAGLLWGRRK